MANKTTNQLADLPKDLVITRTVPHDHSLEILVKPTKVVPTCPYCHSSGCLSKGSDGFQSIRHTADGSRGRFITFKKLRFYCPHCKVSFTYHYPWQHPSLRITNALYLCIVSDLSEIMSIPAIARKNQVTNNVVRDVLDAIDPPAFHVLPETLCVDEFKGDSGVYNEDRKKWDTEKYHCCVADGDNGLVIDILPDRRSATLTRFFRTFSEDERRRVKYFCCDMSGSFAGVARRLFPNAVLCIDRFHVVMNINDAVDLIRRRLQNGFRDNDEDMYKLLKSSKHILLTKEAHKELYWGPDPGDSRCGNRLRTLLETFPDLSEAYGALQEFHCLSDEELEPLRRLALTEWIDRYTSSEVPELRDAACTIRRWKKYILNSFRYGKSNGPCEGLNNRIKSLKRVSYGVHDFENFRKRILLTNGLVKFSDVQYTIFGEKREAAAGKAKGGSQP